MVRSSSLLMTPLLLTVALPARGQESGLAALEAASARYGTFETICADFRQRLENPLLDETRDSSGRLCQRRPNLFRMDFADPAGDEVVADGSHFWLFYKSLNPTQVLQFPLDPERGGLDFFREFLLDPTSKYEVTSEGRESIDGFITWRLSLVPRAPRGLASARVWIDPEAALIRRIEVVDDNGLLRRVDLSEIALDPALASGFFEFDVPPGVDVVANE